MLSRPARALVLVIVLLVPVHLWATLELEPNNSFGEAQTISFGESISGTLSSNQDEDWYRVYASAAGSITFRMDTDEWPDYWGWKAWIHDPAGNVLAAPVCDGSSCRDDGVNIDVGISQAGNYYVGLNLASSGASIRPEIRGEFRHYGITREQFYKNHRAGSGRMYSATPYRGWIMKIAPDGKTTPFASGFRSPNGVNFDAQGRLWATDNQGDWLGTSKLFHVKENNFHGHPASLVWTDSWEKGRNPLKVPPSEFDAKRTRASVLFPQGSMANSPTQMLTDTSGGKFGPFAGQLLVGEMNRPRIMRVLVDEVAGETQGACLPFIDNGGLHRGMHRFVFAPDGSLWVGQTHLSWAGGSGLQRITWTGKTPMSVSAMKLTQTGFKLSFTKPLARAAVENFIFQRYYYKYHQSYGSPQLGKEPIKVTNLKLASDGKSVSINLEKLNPGYVYQLNLKNITAMDKTPVLNTFICYTLNRLTNADNKAPHLTVGSTRKTNTAKPIARENRKVARRICFAALPMPIIPINTITSSTNCMVCDML